MSQPIYCYAVHCDAEGYKTVYTTFCPEDLPSFITSKDQCKKNSASACHARIESLMPEKWFRVRGTFICQYYKYNTM
jgi:hypothetical protein